MTLYVFYLYFFLTKIFYNLHISKLNKKSKDTKFDIKILMSKNDFSIKFDKDTTHSNMELLFMAPKKPTMDLYVQNKNVI
jgi:hypothetical protein